MCGHYFCKKCTTKFINKKNVCDVCIMRKANNEVKIISISLGGKQKAIIFRNVKQIKSKNIG